MFKGVDIGWINKIQASTSLNSIGPIDFNVQIYKIC